MRQSKSILAGISLLLTAFLFIVEYDFHIPDGENFELKWDLEEKLETGKEQRSESPIKLLSGVFLFTPIGERFYRKLHFGSKTNIDLDNWSSKINPCPLPILYCSLKLDYC